MRPNRYRKHEGAAEFVKPSGESWRLACCDCGLVHDVVIEAGNGTVYVSMERNERSTAAMRRLPRRLPRR